jgi:hypothetical protein
MKKILHYFIIKFKYPSKYYCNYYAHNTRMETKYLSKNMFLYDENYTLFKDIITNKNTALLNLQNTNKFYRLLAQEIISGNKITICNEKVEESY